MTVDKEDKIYNPENIGMYMRQSYTKIWLVLICILMLTTGMLLWVVFGTMTSQYETYAIVREGRVICFVPYEEVKTIQMDAEVEIVDTRREATTTGKILSGNEEPVTADVAYDILDSIYIQMQAKLSEWNMELIIQPERELTEGQCCKVRITKREIPVSNYLPWKEEAE